MLFECIARLELPDKGRAAITGLVVCKIWDIGALHCYQPWPMAGILNSIYKHIHPCFPI